MKSPSAHLRCAHHLISLELELPLPALENNTPTTFDSKVYKDCLSDSFQNLIAIVDQHRPIQHLL